MKSRIFRLIMGREREMHVQPLLSFFADEENDVGDCCIRLERKRIGQSEGFEEIVELQANKAVQAENEVEEILRDEDIELTENSLSYGIRLNDEAGIKIALLCLAIKPLQKIRRIKEISAGIQGMSYEEASYWFSKIMGSSSTRLLRAFRIMLSEE